MVCSLCWKVWGIWLCRGEQRLMLPWRMFRRMFKTQLCAALLCLSSPPNERRHVCDTLPRGHVWGNWVSRLRGCVCTFLKCLCKINLFISRSLVFLCNYYQTLAWVFDLFPNTKMEVVPRFLTKVRGVWKLIKHYSVSVWYNFSNKYVLWEKMKAKVWLIYASVWSCFQTITLVIFLCLSFMNY